MFDVAPHADLTGTYLLAHSTQAVLDVCRARWNPATTRNPQQEDGYGDEWVFRASNGQVFAIYSHEEKVHISGKLGQFSAQDLETWILNPDPARAMERWLQALA